MIVLRVCYQHGVRFDEGYYVSTHLPLVQSIFGPFGMIRIEMVKLTTAADGSKPRYQVMFSAYFASESELQGAMQSPQTMEVMGDIRNFYEGMPEVFIGEVIEAVVR